MRKMKIAIVTDAIYPFTLGGSEVRNYEIGKRLVKRGHEVHIFGGKFWKGKRDIEIDGIRIHGIQDYENMYDSNSRRSSLEPALLSVKLFFRMLEEDFDVIDVASFVYFNCFSMKLVSLIKRSRLVFTWHQYFSNYLLGYFGVFKGSVAMILERLSTKLTGNNIAVSKHVQSELGHRGANSEVIYNGADIGLINSIGNQKKEYDLIYVGRLNYQKNLGLLVETMKIIVGKMPGIRICIIGGGAEKKRIIDLIKKYNLGANFDLLGEIKNKGKVFELMKSSKIFVLPSILEGFPLTIVEANACGLPVITTKTRWNNTGEYITGENGMRIEPDAEKMAEVIVSLLQNKKKLGEMAEKGREKAKKFDWDSIADQQERYYGKI